MVELRKFYKIIIFVAKILPLLDCNGVEISVTYYLKGGLLMTTPQIRYREYRETSRHNARSEELTAQANAETQRSNQANEDIRREANTLTKYGIDTSAATARYTADTQAATARYSSNLNASVQQYVSDQNARVQTEQMNTTAMTAERKLRFEREVQAFQKQLQSNQFELQRLSTAANNAKTEAETVKLNEQVHQIAAQTKNVIQDFSLKAREQNNSDAMNRASVALTKMRTVESGVNSVSKAADSLLKIVKEVLS